MTKKIDWREESRRFDGVADLYDAYRPDYPEELVESVISTTGIHQGGRILEIGSGSGKATIMFARRGFTIVCIEPGRNLAAIASQKLKNFPHVEFETVTFEDWNENKREFDLVISAQAFHWIPKETGYEKAARALKENGYIAFFWNMYPDPEGEIFCDLSGIYEDRAPCLTNRTNSFEDLIKQREIEIMESGYFDKVEVKRFQWSARYDTKQYIGLLNTYSDHLRLSEENRSFLFEGVVDVIHKHGGCIEKPYIAVLYVAQKAS
jgi:SAM-dependent methyltransferase